MCRLSTPSSTHVLGQGKHHVDCKHVLLGQGNPIFDRSRQCAVHGACACLATARCSSRAVVLGEHHAFIEQDSVNVSCQLRSIWNIIPVRMEVLEGSRKCPLWREPSLREEERT